MKPKPANQTHLALKSQITNLKKDMHHYRSKGSVFFLRKLIRLLSKNAIKLIKSDIKDSYNVTNDYFTINGVLLNLLLIKEKY